MQVALYQVEDTQKNVPESFTYRHKIPRGFFSLCKRQPGCVWDGEENIVVAVTKNENAVSWDHVYCVHGMIRKLVLYALTSLSLW